MAVLKRDMPIEKIRNIGIVAHIDAGKTTTTERILFYTGKLYKMGSVDDGTATMDFMNQERERGITINSAVITCSWNDCKINIIDTPGHVDFTAEVERSFRILDGAVVIFCAVGGVQPQSETVWRQADRYKVPRIVYINKMDRIGANFERVLDDMVGKLKIKATPIQIPCGAESEYTGNIDLITMKYKENSGNYGENIEETDIPEKYLEKAEIYREKMLDTIADFDEELMEKYLDGEELDEVIIRKAIRKGVLEGDLFPVLCGTSLKNKGVQDVLDGIVHYLPNPLDIGEFRGEGLKGKEIIIRKSDEKEPFSALVFKNTVDNFVGNLCYFRVYSGILNAGEVIFNASKNKNERVSRLLQVNADSRVDLKSVFAGDIVAGIGLKQTFTGDTLCEKKKPVIYESIEFPEPVISVSIEARSSADEEKLIQVLKRFAQEDPTFTIRIDKDTGQTIISGMGELHLDVLVKRLEEEFKIDVHVGKPQVVYKETFRDVCTTEGIYERRIAGGVGQFGHVKLKFKPVKDKKQQVKFKIGIKEGKIPKEFYPAIERGVLEALSNGVLAGFLTTDLEITLIDGSYHETDSNDLAYKLASAQAFRNCKDVSKPILLEPIMTVDIITPEEYLGDVIGDLNTRRAKVVGVDAKVGYQNLKALVPLSELFGYSTGLRTKTQGRATYSMEFEEYGDVPQQISERIVAKIRGE